MNLIASILALGFADRMRGSGWFPYNHIVGQVLMGLVVASILHVNGWAVAYVVFAVLAATTINDVNLIVW